MHIVVIALSVVLGSATAVQEWSEQPEYQEVNPGGHVVMPCVILQKRGECRWEKDGVPIGIYPTKYEWNGSPELGDCSLKVLDASLEYDDGVWQCQVTPSSFTAKDALISEGAQLVVRESPDTLLIQRVGDTSDQLIASAGEDLELECISSGANPPPALRWFAGDQEIETGHSQENSRTAENERKWISISRLTLPVSKEDNGAAIRCEAKHPALREPLLKEMTLAIHYPPSVVIETSSMDYLEEEKDPVTLRCLSDSNPPSTVLWRKDGLEGIFSQEREITFSPVTRHTAGLYSCTAENALGLSKPATVEIDVKYAPRILSVGPTKVVSAKMWNKTLLTCEAEGNPPPRYQWLQKLPTQEVLIRGYSKQLLIENTTYDHQGEFVCKAINEINGEQRLVQSDPIKVEVSGAPQIIKYSAKTELRVQNGEDAVLEVLFCADPLPKQSWHLGDLGQGTGNNLILAPGTGHGRFLAMAPRAADREDCYVSALRINGAHPADSHSYELRLANDDGADSHVIKLNVQEHVSQESLIAVIVGAVLTVLLLILIIIYVCKADKCCSCCRGDKKEFKPSDLESEKTDVESTHSSNLSAPKEPKMAAIPPDALYATSEKTRHYLPYHDSVFNDSKESLRPDMLHVLTPSNLNRTNSSSGELNVSMARISYQDLCFPKTSNYGSMKKKKVRTATTGVDCRLSYAHNDIYS